MRPAALLLALVLIVFGAGDALAQQIPNLTDLVPAGDGSASGRILQLVLVITVLSVAPGLLIMVTCFTRFVRRAFVPARRARACRPRLPT